MRGWRRLLRAAFPDQTVELDLHGLGVADALERVAATLREAERRGVRQVRIVCGKGKGSPGGRGVLRDAVPGWLETHGYRDRYRREVERDGRDGALRVSLGDRPADPQ